MKDLVVFRCRNCIADLKEHNPYIYPDGTPIPRRKIEVIEVPREYCENNEENMQNKPQLQAPIRLNKEIENPWVVKFWETEEDAKDGYATVFDRFEDFKAAKAETIATARICNWVSAEIYLDTGDKKITVYFYDGEKPGESKFIKHSEVEK